MQVNVYNLSRTELQDPGIIPINYRTYMERHPRRTTNKFILPCHQYMHWISTCKKYIDSYKACVFKLASSAGGTLLNSNLLLVVFVSFSVVQYLGQHSFLQIMETFCLFFFSSYHFVALLLFSFFFFFWVGVGGGVSNEKEVYAISADSSLQPG